MVKHAGFHTANFTVAISTSLDNLETMAISKCNIFATLAKTNVQLMATNTALIEQFKNSMETSKKMAEKNGSGGSGGGGGGCGGNNI